MVVGGRRVRVAGSLLWFLPQSALAAICGNWVSRSECDRNRDGSCECVWDSDVCNKGTRCGGIGAIAICDNWQTSSECERNRDGGCECTWENDACSKSTTCGGGIGPIAICDNWQTSIECQNNNDGGCGCVFDNDACTKGTNCGGFGTIAICDNWQTSSECESNIDGGCECVWDETATIACSKGTTCGGMGIVGICSNHLTLSECEGNTDGGCECIWDKESCSKGSVCGGIGPTLQGCAEANDDLGNPTVCRPHGANADQANCVSGDHCRCASGYVCADTKMEGECGTGTGATVHCEASPTTTTNTTTPTTTTTTTTTTQTTTTTTTTTNTSMTTTTTTMTTTTTNTAMTTTPHSVLTSTATNLAVTMIPEVQNTVTTPTTTFGVTSLTTTLATATMTSATAAATIGTTSTTQVETTRTTSLSPEPTQGTLSTSTLEISTTPTLAGTSPLAAASTFHTTMAAATTTTHIPEDHRTTKTHTATLSVTTVVEKILAAVRFIVDPASLSSMQSQEGLQAVAAALTAEFGLPAVVLGSCLSNMTLDGKCHNSKAHRRLTDEARRRLDDETVSLHYDFYLNAAENAPQTITQALERLDLLESGQGATALQLESQLKKEFNSIGMQVSAMKLEPTLQPENRFVRAPPTTQTLRTTTSTVAAMEMAATTEEKEKDIAALREKLERLHAEKKAALADEDPEIPWIIWAGLCAGAACLFAGVVCMIKKQVKKCLALRLPAKESSEEDLNLNDASSHEHVVVEAPDAALPKAPPSNNTISLQQQEQAIPKGIFPPEPSPESSPKPPPQAATQTTPAANNVKLIIDLDGDEEKPIELEATHGKPLLETILAAPTFVAGDIVLVESFFLSGDNPRVPVRQGQQGRVEKLAKGLDDYGDVLIMFAEISERRTLLVKQEDLGKLKRRDEAFQIV